MAEKKTNINKTAEVIRGKIQKMKARLRELNKEEDKNSENLRKLRKKLKRFQRRLRKMEKIHSRRKSGAETPKSGSTSST